ncbi:hypothetical protein NDU88_006966 [Pleurodeles waltl]|uniref:Uncharacterized protein n=1 Tax=Pleurodeles waltl TaxID=8319 RepID=A0AAV7VPB8_PLEWA|nr:hypothetical protein NDU88_006966 [Pleurodeles waltl]
MDYPRARRLNKSNTGARPSRAQAAESQAKPLKDADLFVSTKGTTYREAQVGDSNSSQDHSSDCTSPILIGPELTPRLADDI